MSIQNRASAPPAAATRPAAPLPTDFNPMEGVVTAGGGGSVTAGSYQASFVGADLLPATDADPMTGKGGRQWAAIKFRWQLEDGREVTRETPANTGQKSGYVQTVGWLLGRMPAASEAFSLTPCVGRMYLITVGAKVNKVGQPTGWTEVTACIPLPAAKS